MSTKKRTIGSVIGGTLLNLAAGLLAPALFVREAALAAGAGELSAWLVSRGV